MSAPSEEQLFHMAIEANFREQTANGGLYFPPTYESDGFIHATGNPLLLLEVPPLLTTAYSNVALM